MPANAVVAAAFVLAVVAAARSTWSPCGISMLSTLTPLGERSRGHRYPVTVGWFVTGATAGGVTLGAGAAAVAYGVGRSSPSVHTVALVVVVAALVGVAADVRLAGFHLPTVPRQVNEVWTGRYRSWVYAVGFGWQIGVGLTTYVMTAAVYLTIVLAAMTGQPVMALLIGTTFGLARGLAILLGVRLTTPEAIRSFHRRFEGADLASRYVAVMAQLSVVAVAVDQWWAAVAVPVVVLGGCGYAVASRTPLLSATKRV